MNTMKRFLVWLMLLGLTLAGCGQPIETELPPTNVVAPSLMPAPSATSTDKPTATPTQAMATETPTLEPSPTGMVTPTLTVREPSVKQVATYLKWINPEFRSYGPGIDELDIETFSEDVTGDQNPDVIALNPPDVYVLIWMGGAYSKPVKFSGNFPSRGYPFAEVSFKDWTADGISEIIFDNRDLGGGTGYFVYDTTRYIIHCSISDCVVVWQGLLSSDINDAISGGLGKYKSNVQAVKDQAGNPALQSLFGGFAVYTQPLEDVAPFADHEFSGLYVHTTTLSIYSWTGVNFELTNDSVISAGYIVNSQASLEATSQVSVKASVSIIKSYRLPEVLSENDVCQLSIKGEQVGSSFDCKQNFASVEWKDITGDGRDDVVIVALSGAIGRNAEFLSEKKCVHQRLLAYQWDESTATEIANVTGCVVRNDLYGVRLEDYDQDGHLEILAAADSEQSRDQIYKWNGSRFVFWDDVPGQ